MEMFSEIKVPFENFFFFVTIADPDKSSLLWNLIFGMKCLKADA